MLMHEWLKYRDEQVKKGEAQPPEEPEDEPRQAEEPVTVAEDQASYQEVQRIAAEISERGDEAQSTRLQTLLARQQRLPLEVEPARARASEDQRLAKESREELVERLLDPTLTLSETASLLGVCPTTVRRYTKRGVLNCFRTPGNQRRFKLSDVLNLMEQQQTQA